jgi:hypothetical protein
MRRLARSPRAVFATTSVLLGAVLLGAVVLGSSALLASPTGVTPDPTSHATPGISRRDAGEAPTLARPREDRIATAEQALADGDPDHALQLVDELLGGGPWSHDVLVRLWRTRATALAFLDDKDGAVAAFATLLTFAPGFALPYTASPRVTVAFERARQQRAGRPPITLAVETPLVARLDEVIVLGVRRRADPEGRVTQLRIVATDENTGAVVNLVVAAPVVGDAAIVELPARPAASAVVDDAGRPGVVLRVDVAGLDARGSDLVVVPPVVLPVGFDAPAPWWQEPPVWLGGGAVVAVVAAAVTAAVVVAALPPERVPVEATVRR